MPSLREELEERDAADIAAILEAAEPDTALAALWRTVLDEGDPVSIIGHAVLWCTRPVLAAAVAECVGLVVDRARRALRPQLVATLEVIERYARGAATVDDVFDARRDVQRIVEDAPTTAVLNATEAAGSADYGFDDEALNSAGEALLEVIAIAGAPARAAVLEILTRRLPSPSIAAFAAAHAWRDG